MLLMWNVKIEYKKFVIHKKRNNFFVSHKDEILFFWHVIIFLLLRDNKNISPWHYSKQCPKQKFGVARKTIFCRILCLFLFLFYFLYCWFWLFFHYNLRGECHEILWILYYFNPSRRAVHLWKLYWNKNWVKFLAFIKPYEAPQRSVKINI